MKLKLLKLLKKLSRVSRISSRFSRFLAVFVYFSYFSSYFATTENQILHAYKDWTGLISKDDSIISSADVLSSEDISSEAVSLDINEDMADLADLAVSNDTPASSDNDSNDNFDSFVSLVSHDTNDTGNTADTEEQSDTEGDTESDTEGEAEDSDEDSADMADSGNTVGPVAPVPSAPDEDNNTNNENNENNPNNPNTPDDSESIAVLTTRLTSDHHLIATLSISGIMGADVAVFPNITGSNTTNATGPDEVKASGPDEFTSAGGNIYTVSNVPNTLDTGGSYAGSDGSSPVSEDKPDSLLLNFENEEGVVESVRLWLDNEIDETVILDGISIPSDDTINTSADMADFSSRAYDGAGSNVSQANQANQPRLAVPILLDLTDLSSSSSSDLAAISDTSSEADNVDNVNTGNTGYALGHSLDSFIDLSMIKSPIIVILPGTNEQYYFADGRALAAYDRFDQEYRVLEVRATTRAEIEIRLVRK